MSGGRGDPQDDSLPPIGLRACISLRRFLIRVVFPTPGNPVMMMFFFILVIYYLTVFIQKRNYVHEKSFFHTQRPNGLYLWIFGFTGSERFYYGKPISGTIYFFTLGLLGIGWFLDLFLIPSMAREADLRFMEGNIDYNVAWILLTFLGLFGVHRFYMGKWLSGLLYLFTLGIFGIGYIYDFWTLNDQITVINGSEG